MKSNFTRSTTGCSTCKRKKKKCDETFPECMRCVRLGLECGGYPPLQNPDSRGVMRRAKAGAATSESSAISAQPSRSISPSDSGSSSRSRQVAPSVRRGYEQAATYTIAQPRVVQTQAKVRTDPQSVNSRIYGQPNSSNSHLDSGSSSIFEAAINAPPRSDTQHDTQTPNAYVPKPHNNRFIYDNSQSSNSPAYSPLDYLSTDSLAARIHSNQSSRYAPIARPTNRIMPFNDGRKTIVYGPVSPPSRLTIEPSEEESTSSDEHDPEGVRQIMCRSPIPDPNSPDNALPFVLQSYARWVNLTSFEPLRIVQPMKSRIIAHFSGSDTSRTRIILLANVIGLLGKHLKLNSKGHSLVAILRTQTHQAFKYFHSTYPTGQSEMSKQEASKVLDYITEMMTVQRFSGSMTSAARLMEAAAPVFRRACPEPLEQLINLPNILTNPTLNANLRYFAAADVILSAATARPLLFRYDTAYTPEAANRIGDRNSGIHWLYGVPSQFVIVLAWISALQEDYGPAVDPKLVLDTERQIQSILLAPTSVHADPFTMIWRLAVQECWRQALYIYLYMFLCGVRADDPRVVRTVRAFMRILDGVKPGRHPDLFLTLPIMIVGAGTRDPRDQYLLRQRLLGLPECKNPGTSVHQFTLVLADIWERTQSENRPATWSDFRIANYKVAGI